MKEPTREDGIARFRELHKALEEDVDEKYLQTVKTFDLFVDIGLLEIALEAGRSMTYEEIAERLNKWVGEDTYELADIGSMVWALAHDEEVEKEFVKLIHLRRRDFREHMEEANE